MNHLHHIHGDVGLAALAGTQNHAIKKPAKLIHIKPLPECQGWPIVTLETGDYDMCCIHMHSHEWGRPTFNVSQHPTRTV